MKQQSRVKTEPPRNDIELKILQNTPPWEWPKNAGKKFQAILTDRTAPESERIIAAELAGDYVAINDELANTLMEILGTAGESARLRATTATSLGPALEAADIGDFDDLDDVPISEEVFHKIQRFLHMLYLEESVPKEVRRRILEASVRAPEDWHADAIKKAYASGDRDWLLTAVYGMRRVRGFDNQILEALKSKDADIHREAVHAAGNWEIDAAWSHVWALVKNASKTPKPLLLAAIGAAGSIRPSEALETLNRLADSDDEDIAEAADEALAMAEGHAEFDEDDLEEDQEEDASGWIN